MLWSIIDQMYECRGNKLNSAYFPKYTIQYPCRTLVKEAKLKAIPFTQ